MSAQSAAMNLTFLLFSLAMAVATGATALVSRAYGAKDVPEYRAAAQQSLNLAVVTSVILALLSFVLTPFVGHYVLPADADRGRELMVQYVAMFALGLPAIYIIQTLAACLRGVGDTKSPMVISGLQIALHILLNFVMIFPARPATFLGAHFMLPGVGLGLPGAAVAMTISAWLSAVVYVVYSRRTPLGNLLSIRLPRRDWAARILRISIPSALMSFLRVLSLTAFTVIIAKSVNGEPAIAAMGVAFAVESIMFMPAFGLSMATSALVGQSLGAKKPDRAERVTWVAAHSGALVIAALVVPIYLYSPLVAKTMISSEPVSIRAESKRVEPVVARPDELAGKQKTREEAVSLIRWLCLTEVLFSYAMIMIGAMQGAGDTVRPVWITIWCLWLLRVPLAWLLVHPVAMGPTGAWIAMSLSQAIQGAMAIVVFRRGQWKTQQV